MFFVETVTPRESSIDTATDKANIKVETSDDIEDNQPDIPIVTNPTENIQVDETQDSLPNQELDQKIDAEGAVGGIDDDSVFVDEDVAIASKVALLQSSSHRSSCDNDEEVDDIELILSSDDKEFPQEDLVSISYYEPWQMCGQSGTPVLVNFNNISSDNEGADDDESREKLSASPSPIDPDQFYNAIKENVAQQQQQLSLESSDSLSLGENFRQSYDLNTKSLSLDKESDPKTSDENGLIRDESFDTFEQV